MKAYSRSQGKIIEIPDINSMTRVSQNTVPQQKSVAGFAGNIGRDIGENVQGLLNLPGLLVNILTGKADLGETGRAVGEGVVSEYKDLITKPTETVYNKPVSSVLDIIPFLSVAKGLTAAKFASGVSKTSKATTATKTAVKATPKQGFLERTGSSLRAGVTKPKVIASPYGAKTEEALSQASDIIGLKGSAASKYSQLPAKMDELSSKIKSKLTADKKPIEIDTVKKDLLGALDENINYDPGIKAYTSARDKFFNQLTQKVSKSGIADKTSLAFRMSPKILKLDLFEYKQNLGRQLKPAFSKLDKGNPLTPAEEVGVTIYRRLKPIIDGSNKEISKLTEMQEKLYDLSPGLEAQRSANLKLPVVGQIPATAVPFQATRDLTGRVLQKTGKLGADKILSETEKAVKATAKSPLSYILGRQLNQPSRIEQQNVNQELRQEELQAAKDLQDSLETTSEGSISKEQLITVLLNPNISETTKKNVRDIYDLGIGSADEQKKQTQRTNAGRVIDQLEKLYFSAHGTGTGRTGGVFSFLQRISGGNPLLQRYVRLKQTVRPLLARTLGEVGNLAEGEQQAVVGALPDEFSTYEEAVGGFNDMRLALGLKPRIQK